ncbi:hypothetical protein FHG68_17345 [Leptospira weilii]|nr:hypothetical protein FHG67_17290 [Leptospira weilii]QDK28228.1 hypothetical protein FHG68_17345 [Leptospira weilii]
MWELQQNCFNVHFSETKTNGELIFQQLYSTDLYIRKYRQFYSSLRNRVSKILRLNAGFILKLTVLYFIGISSTNLCLMEYIIVSILGRLNSSSFSE